MRLVFKKVINGEERIISATTASGNQGSYVKIIAGVGTPFWMWNTLPPGHIIAADFTNAPIVSADVNVNNTNIGNITVAPEDVLTFQL